MANDEHLGILWEGVEVWNAWRKEHPDLMPDLSTADLKNANLRGANLTGVNLQNANLWGANLAGVNLEDLRAADKGADLGPLGKGDLRDARLQGAKLCKADLTNAHLERAVLHGADLTHADLERAYLGHANLQHAILREADLTGAHLSDADLSGADLKSANLERIDLTAAYLKGADLTGANLTEGAHLRGTDLQGVKLYGADLGKAVLEGTAFADVDLSQVKGLDSVKHLGPSTIGTDTLTRSLGKIPALFLRGCGLADWEIVNARLYDPDLTRDERTEIAYEVVNLQAESPIVLHHVFISYSHEDTAFVEKLEASLDEKRIRYWRDVHDMKAGRMEKQIERAIRLNPLVLLVLSERSVESDWVEWEVSKTRELEKTEKRDVLCPISLDEAWKTCDWPGPLRRQIMDYNILDFSDPEAFDEQFEKLVGGIVENYPAG